MRTSNFGNGRHVAVLVRLCLAIIVTLTIAVGGVTLKTGPVEAAFDINPASYTDNLTECVPFAFTPFTQAGFTCINPPENVFFWAVGAVPTWVNIDPITGELSGCPDPGSAGYYNFQVFATELCNHCPACLTCPAIPCTSLSSLRTVELGVAANPQPCNMVINPTFYPVAWENMPFSMTLSVTGGSGTYNWSATGLPAGLSVTDPVNGIISGVPAPGTCGSCNVTATVSDTGTCCPGGPCCCPPVSRPFILIVDCWANYIFYISNLGTYFGDTFTVEIGPGLTQGLTSVFIDGSHEATLGRNQSETFLTYLDQLHLVTVDQFISGPDANTRFSVMGSNQVVVGGTHNTAYFDYEKQFLITTASEPAGVSQPPGIGFYSVGSNFCTTAPSPVSPNDPAGIKYVFSEWKLPDGSTQPNRDVSFNVNQTGRVTALYNTYYLLQLKSDYPPVNETSWHLKDSSATWNLALQPVPLPGFWGGLGGVLSPINASGSHIMTGSHTEEILWKRNYTWPIIIIIIILLVIAGLGYFLYRRSKLGPTRPTPKKEAPAPKRKPQQPKAKASRRPARTKPKAK
jgi:hypothetical protein